MLRLPNINPKPTKSFEVKRNKDDVRFYNSKRWKAFRLSYLKQNPLCIICTNMGRTREATVVDHITPIRLGGSHFDLTNLQPMCASHHNRKSASESRKK